MRSKLLHFFLIFFISFSSNSSLIYAANSEKAKEDKNSISVNYLKNLPNNYYIVGPGDSLQIIVSREYPELNSQVIIDGEGTIYLPRLKRIFVNGLSLNELNEILNEAYSEFVKYPSVEVQILNYRPIKVLVQGEVGNPGLKTMPGSMSLEQNTQISINQSIKPDPLNMQINRLSGNPKFNNYFPTVFDAIRQSGGITEYSDLSKIQIIRKANLSNGSGLITTKLNFENVLLNGDNSQNIRIYDSDIIKVKKLDKPNKKIFSKAILSNLNKKFLNVFVFGSVVNPGDITVSRQGTLNDAVEIAGTKALRGPLTFIRFNNDGSVDKRKFKYRRKAKRGSYNNPLLEDGDLIVVGFSSLTLANEIITEVTKPFVGVLSTYGLIKAIND